MKRSTITNLEKEEALLSNERTMLSYIRTSFAALLFGFALLQFSKYDNSLTLIGSISIAIGIILLGLGLTYYEIRKRKIRSLA